MKSWLRIVAQGVVVVGCLWTSVVCQAADNSEILIREGVELRKSGQDSKALPKFLKAYNIAHTPRATAQLGLCEQALSAWIEADLHLTEALAAASDVWVGQNRKTLERSRTEVRTHLASVSITGATSGATVSVDGSFATTLPEPTLVTVLPGQIEVRAVAPSGYHPYVRTLTMKAGEVQRLEVTMQPNEAVAPAVSLQGTSKPDAVRPFADRAKDTDVTSVPADEAQGTSWARTIGWGALVVGGLSFAGGVASHVGYYQNGNTFGEDSRGCGRSAGVVSGGDECEDLANRYDSYRGFMIAGYASAAAFSVAGGLLLWLNPQKEVDKSAFRSPATCGFAVIEMGLSCSGTF